MPLIFLSGKGLNFTPFLDVTSTIAVWSTVGYVLQFGWGNKSWIFFGIFLLKKTACYIRVFFLYLRNVEDLKDQAKFGH